MTAPSARRPWFWALTRTAVISSLASRSTRRGRVPVARGAKECTIRRNARSPYVLDTRELGRRPGAMRTVHRTVAAPPDLGTDVIGVPAGSDLQLNLRLEAVMEGVLVSGRVRGTATGECVRCLGDVEEPFDIEFQELFVYPDRALEAEEEEMREIDGEHDRPRTRAARCGGARTTVPAGVPGRLPGALPAVRDAPGRGPRPPARGHRSSVAGPAGPGAGRRPPGSPHDEEKES